MITSLLYRARCASTWRGFGSSSEARPPPRGRPAAGKIFPVIDRPRHRAAGAGRGSPLCRWRAKALPALRSRRTLPI